MRTLSLFVGIASALAVFTQYKLTVDDKFNARAIDGTPAAFYFQEGSTDDWVIYFEGGGWCYSEADCYGRSKGTLGSSTNIPATVNLGGLLSNDCAVTPLCNYNMVYLKYLDGNSFSGMRADPVMFNNGTADVPLWFRGRANLDAVLDAVNRNIMGSKHLIQNARNVVETGCSAGGLATYLHADYVMSQVPHSGQYFSAPISGYFIDSASVSGGHVYGDEIKVIYGLSNASTNAACQAFYAPTGDDWKCNMAEYVYPFVEANVFVLNSKYDSWQTNCIMTSEPVTNPAANGNCSAAPGWNGCSRAVANCTAEQITGTVLPFGGYMHDSITNTNVKKSAAPGQGGFISSCHTHCEAQGGDFDKFTVGDVTMVAAFSQWYTQNLASGGKSPAGPNWHVDCDYLPTGNHQCNPNCPVA